jgi:hypothetical protein
MTDMNTLCDVSAAPSDDALSADSWMMVKGALDVDDVVVAARRAAVENGLRLTCRPAEGWLSLTLPDAPAMARELCVRWRTAAPMGPTTSSYHVPPQAGVELLITCDVPVLAPIARRLGTELEARVRPFTAVELRGIVASMPLVERFASPDPALAGWALICRDHYLEHTVGFILGMESAGIPPEWILALAKGDQTTNRHRIHATFMARGSASDVLDNPGVEAAADPLLPADPARALAAVDAFIDRAHSAGRKVLLIDDGGVLLNRGYGRAGSARVVDAAIELTVSGLKRIARAGQLAIPVLNMARSQVKTSLGYLEIADSCLRRLRATVPAQKFIGRPVLLIGFGTLGSRLGWSLRGLGCQVSVVDTDILALIAAAERGFTTYPTVVEALRAFRPSLVVGTSGEASLSAADVELLPDGVHLAPFATRDFSILTDPASAPPSTEIPGIGRRCELAGGRSATLLGDGRSLNVFQADPIPNQGYDVYRAATVIVAKALCADHAGLPAGVHTDPADAAIAAANLYRAYYHRYLAASRSPIADEV